MATGQQLSRGDCILSPIAPGLQQTWSHASSKDRQLRARSWSRECLCQIRQGCDECSAVSNKKTMGNYYGHWVRNGLGAHAMVGSTQATLLLLRRPNGCATKRARKNRTGARRKTTWVTDTAGCLLNSFSPTVKCQTARMRMELKNDQPVRYRRTARYGKKADGHINVIPGRWTPAFGCVDDKTGKAVPLKNVMFGHNEQQKATDWRTKENSPNNPGCHLAVNHGWGDQMGI